MRILKLIELEFDSKKIRKEEELETMINDKSIPLEHKVKSIVQIFEDLAILELAEKQFKNYLPDKK